MILCIEFDRTWTFIIIKYTKTLTFKISGLLVIYNVYYGADAMPKKPQSYPDAGEDILRLFNSNMQSTLHTEEINSRLMTVLLFNEKHSGIIAF